MQNSQLEQFITQSKAAGKTIDQIKAQLLGAGWPQADVDQALGIGNAIAVPAYVPDQAANFNMWVVFEYVLMFITLAFSAMSLAGLAHQFVNDKISAGNAVNYSSYYNSYLTPGYVATSIIAFPIFAFLALLLRRRLEKNPAIRSIKFRKIFIYIALIWTFLALITRLIMTVYAFINGDAKVLNTLSHLLVTLMISGSIFTYFVIEIRQDSGKTV